MDSITSMKTSFFLYLIPSDLQETALVTVVGTLLLVTSSLAPSCVMYLKSVADRQRACSHASARACVC